MRTLQFKDEDIELIVAALKYAHGKKMVALEAALLSPEECSLLIHSANKFRDIHFGIDEGRFDV